MLKIYKYHDWVENLLLSLNYDNEDINIGDLTSIELFKHPSNKGLLYYIATNPSDVAMEIINQHIGKIDNTIDSKGILLKSIIVYLCYNTNNNAIDILEKYVECIDKKYQSKFLNTWDCLCQNTNNKAVELCKKTNNIDMFYLSGNSSDAALDILCDNIDEIDWTELSSNSNDRAVELLKQRPEKIVWSYLSRNSNDKVYDMLRENPDKISWLDLLVNKNSRILGLYHNNMDKMQDNYWNMLCENNCDKALEILEANEDRIDWNVLASNNNDKAIKILSENMDKIRVELLVKNTNPKALDLIMIMKNDIKSPTSIACLLSNPNIFTYNYEAIREHMKNTWLLDLLKYWHHPKNANKWFHWGWDDYPDFDNFGF